MNTSTRIRWITIIVFPIALMLWFTFNPAKEQTDYLINGIILSCVCVFLLKAVLFAIISSHLKQQTTEKKYALYQLIPIFFFALYIIWYFLH